MSPKLKENDKYQVWCMDDDSGTTGDSAKLVIFRANFQGKILVVVFNPNSNICTFIHPNVILSKI